MIEPPPGSTNPPNIDEWYNEQTAIVAREERYEDNMDIAVEETRRRDMEGESDE